MGTSIFSGIPALFFLLSFIGLVITSSVISAIAVALVDNAWNTRYQEVPQAHILQQRRSLGRRIVDAFEIERHRIERDLHDGAQQYLVAANMKIGEAIAIGELNESALSPQVNDLLHEAQTANDQALHALRQTVQGVAPQVLTDRGLAEAVAEVASSCPVNVRLHIPHPLPPLPAGVSSAAYFLVCEALTNVAKYAPNATCNVLLTAGNDLRVSIVDDGPGGAEIHPGHGLSGLRARLQAFGGDLTISSPDGGPTEIQGRLPLLLDDGQSAVVMDE